MRLKENKTRFIAFNLFLFFSAVYLLTASGLNFYHTDAGLLRIDTVKSIVERQDLSVSEDIGIIGDDGRPYSWVGIGSALLAVPFYIAGKIVGAPETSVSVMNQLAGAATVVLVFLFCISLSYSRRASVMISIFYGLGTFAWPLAKQPFDHAVETLFVLFSVYCMYLYVTDRKIFQLLLSAISLGIAFLTRPTSMLILLPLFILISFHCLKKSNFRSTGRLVAKDFFLVFSVLLPFLGLSLWYNYFRFGSVFETGYSLIAARTGLDFFKGTPLLTGLGGFLISPGKGFFYYSPVAILFFFSIRNFMKKHLGLGISFIFIIISYLFFLSKYLYWHGDWAWGPRYLLVITPFLVIPMAELLESDLWMRKKFLRVVVCCIFALSLVIQMAAVSVDFCKYFEDLKFKKQAEFVIAGGEGVTAIVLPPAGTYFDWNGSPILAQFRFIREIAGKMEYYRYSKVPEDAPITEILEVSPRTNVLDFWWIYKYFIDNSYAGFIVALTLLLLAIYAAVRVWTHSR